MKRLFALFCLISFPALAATPAQTAFNKLNACAQRHVLADCRQLVTASSVSLYDRFDNYGFARCFPQQVKYLSEKKTGQHVVVRAGAQDKGQDQGLRLAFVEEEGQMKLDVPMSLQLWLGANWESRITAAEQLYVVLHQQFGDAVSCDSAKALIK